MSIRALLQGGDRRSKGRSDALAAEATHDPGLIAELVEALLDSDELVRLRAADALEKASAESPRLLAPHAAKILGPVADLDQYEVRWHVAQMLPRLALDGVRLRRAATVLATTLECKSRIARVMAMDALVELADRAPRLRHAAARAVARALAGGSPAEQARARQLVKRRKWLAPAVGAPLEKRRKRGSST
jgi:HEAT repeat protein